MPRPRSGALDDMQAGGLASYLNRGVNSPDTAIGTAAAAAAAAAAAGTDFTIPKPGGTAAGANSNGRRHGPPVKSVQHAHLTATRRANSRLNTAASTLMLLNIL